VDPEARGTEVRLHRQLAGYEVALAEPIVVVDGARTAVGSFGGVFKDVPGFELGAVAVKSALRRAGVGALDIEEVVMGCIGQVGPDAYNARRVAAAAGLPITAPAYTVNRLCGSGLQAVWSAAMEMRWNDLPFTVAGGDESMSQMPFYDFEARTGYKLGNRRLMDGTVMMLTDPFHNIHMGITAENVARKYDVSRQAQDEFALLSQRRAASAQAQAAFAEEITPVTVASKIPVIIEHDEHPRPDTTLEALGGLRPAFDKSGTVTAGNSSGINDGGAALVLAKQSAAATRGLSAGQPRGCRHRGHGAGSDGLRARAGFAEAVRENRHVPCRYRDNRAQRGLRLASGRGDS
jgi:acetyl-CoA C-acetyltransferase